MTTLLFSLTPRSSRQHLSPVVDILTTTLLWTAQPFFLKHLPLLTMSQTNRTPFSSKAPQPQLSNPSQPSFVLRTPPLQSSNTTHLGHRLGASSPSVISAWALIFVSRPSTAILSNSLEHEGLFVLSEVGCETWVSVQYQVLGESKPEVEVFVIELDDL